MQCGAVLWVEPPQKSHHASMLIFALNLCRVEESVQMMSLWMIRIRRADSLRTPIDPTSRHDPPYICDRATNYTATQELCLVWLHNHDAEKGTTYFGTSPRSTIAAKHQPTILKAAALVFSLIRCGCACYYHNHAPKVCIQILQLHIMNWYCLKE